MVELKRDAIESAAGVVLVDKPVGMTSFAVVQKLRRLLGIKKIGHTGTLDPFASGLLILCVGREATRHIDQFMGGRKTYHAVLQLGQETDTLDLEGRVTAVKPVPELTAEGIATLLAEFVGPQLQAPPAYSAAKYQGKPLYHYARQGIVIEKEAKPIEIYSLDLHNYDTVTAQLAVTVSCSRGTYIRVLAADIGRRLGCGAHLTALRRTYNGGFTVEEAVDGVQLFSGSDALALLQAGMLTVEKALARTEPQ
ncbi:tRNA pseudouridine(55) synthase TruB [Candidatus Electronema sp. PJ]|uniref:tRNA pseudouridine(55) synthase TruB n=1 Tax=Candidatus Electronema sp. PJ TaxID=3401572 RepID=UPI003AA808EC